VASATHWQDDAYAPTRLGEPTVTVRLARWDGGRLVPWAEEGDRRHAWQLSQLTVRRARLAGEAPALSASVLEDVRGTMADHGKYCVVVPLERRGDVWVGRAVNGNMGEVGLTYDARFGLQYQAGDPS
jgi:CRISPR-associated endonuclease/helicase Cas3